MHLFRIARSGALQIALLLICTMSLANGQPAEDPVIPLQNWPAPLYWQLPASAQNGAAQQAEKAGLSGSNQNEAAAQKGAKGEKAASSTRSLISSNIVPLVFVAMVPCRLMDTRDGSLPYPFGPPSMNGPVTRTVTVPTLARCGIPYDAVAYSVNFTVVPFGGLSYLSAWPTPYRPSPEVSILNSFDGRVVANAAVVPAGVNGSIDVFVTNPTHVIIDINGYYVLQTQTRASGYVNYDGTYDANGFSVTHNAVGYYLLTYDRSFPSSPTVSLSITASPNQVLCGFPVYPEIINSSTQTSIQIRDQNHNPVSCNFWFTALRRWPQ
jgi:hypothetical protein